MKTKFTIIFSLFIHCVFSQIHLTGLVLDTKDSVAIGYAHLSTFAGKIGTYSNEAGQYNLYLPDSLLQDTLVVSRIGYKTFSVHLNTFEDRDTLVIRLEENALNLQEIVIYDIRDSVTAIVKKVIKSFKKNYPTKTHYLEGFYRELSLKGEIYTRLVEASIGVTEHSYTIENTKSRVEIQQLRKSEDYRDYSIKVQLYEAAMRKMAKLAWDFEIDNNIYKMLDMNYPKMNEQKIREKNDKWYFIKEFEFEIEDVVKNENQTLYRIKFYMPPETSTAFAYYGGKMTINIEDYAIIEWEFGMLPHPYKTFPNQNKMLCMEGYFGKRHVLYTKINDVYFPTLFEFFSSSGRGTTSSINPVTGKRDHQYDKVTFMVNHVVTSKREFDRIKKRDLLDNEIDVFDAKTPYDSIFWDNYNILLLDPLLKSAKEDLEKENTLEQQFKKNGE